MLLKRENFATEAAMQCLHRLDEVLVQAGVGSQFWMESCGKLMPLSDGYDATIGFGKDFDIGRECTADVGGTDEGHGKVCGDARNISRSMEAALLSSVGIAMHVDVQGAES